MDTDERDKLKLRIADGYLYLNKKLKIKNTPRVILIEDTVNAKKEFGNTGYFNPDTNKLILYVTGRHSTDVLRTFFHECVHVWQHNNGKFNVLNEGYAQENPHLRKMEQQAYLIGNMMFRDYQDMKREQGYE